MRRNDRNTDVEKSPKKERTGNGLNKYFRERAEKRYRDGAADERIIRAHGESLGFDAPKDMRARGGSPDARFLICTAALLCLGAVTSYSASCIYAEQKYGDGSYFLVRYLIFALVAAAFTAPFALFATPRLCKRITPMLFSLSLILLLLVIFVGSDGGGAKRWLAIGPLTVQPSEIAKTATVMMLALYMSEREDKIKSRRRRESFLYGLVIPLCIFGSVCLLVALEKHISGLMIIGMLGISVMYMGGTRMKWIAVLLGAVGAAGVLLILVSSYAQDRVNTWLHIEEVDPLGSAWQTLQGLYAIGSGGFFGRGLGNSRQKYGYVSQPQNDFIFTVICEELGFIGAACVIGLFACLVVRGFKIAARTADKFASLLVFGLTFKVALQTVLNIAVVTNSMPNTGISLPFFSSGGTSLALQIFEMGIILSVSRYSTVKKQ